jgi:hypothetical protein
MRKWRKTTWFLLVESGLFLASIIDALALVLPYLAVLVYFLIRNNPSPALAEPDAKKRQRLAAEAEAREARRQHLARQAAHLADVA